ncbi:hypothetical protein [Hydrogenophaga sp. NFH-34]|uniref:hypothetical protein n=1 Tax=Hydrogenophaga sp. NFH-34 TaxID=2744446 RepID=UPI001F19B7FA|nr:hypothetical protein [Hydrogenophaga sp. NFH-34]
MRKQEAFKTVQWATGALVETCPEWDYISGSEQDLREAGYTGAMPKRARFHDPAFPGTDSRDTIYWDGFGPFRWTRYLSEDEVAERKTWAKFNEVVDPALTTTAWFRNDRRFAVARALEMLAARMDDGADKAIAEAAIAVLRDKGASASELDALMAAGVH